jgi:tRNA threonylcarbamoyladenosine biosynthesis protein TsaB
MMPGILAIDSSTEACSCALIKDGTVSETFEIIPRQHAKCLLPMVKNLLSDHSLEFNDLQAVAYGQGPGSFTGLRIAAGVTQGIAFAAKIPVIPVSTLAALAYQVKNEQEQAIVFSALDARIDEIYWGMYASHPGSMVLLGKEELCKPELLPEHRLEEGSTFVGVGSGMHYFDRMPDKFRKHLSIIKSDLYPRAGIIAQIAETYFIDGNFQTPEMVHPVYLRDKVTHC